MRRYNELLPVSQIYTYVWSKYRPAILHVMKACLEGTQKYKFSDHEFRCLNPKQKGGYAFTLSVSRGKAVNNIKTSMPAQGLLLILQQSRTACELSEASTYEFIFDRYFTLHVTRQEKIQETIPEHAVVDQLIF